MALYDMLGAGQMPAGLLSEQEQQQLNSNALLNSGLAILAASRGGQQGVRGRAPLIPAIQQGLQAGQQTYGNALQNYGAQAELARKLQQMQAQKEMQSLFSSGGPDKAALYMQAAERAAAAGDSETAKRYADIAQSLAPKAADSPFGKIDPKDYTAASIAKFNETKNYADLRPKLTAASINPERLGGDAGAMAQLMFGTSDLSKLNPQQREQVLNASKAAGQEKKVQNIPAELRARLSLGESYASQVPDMIAAIKEGKSGALGTLTNTGQSGLIAQRQESGVDALVRNLTGAGKSAEEAEAYAKRYSFSATDSDARKLEKISQLSQELRIIDANAKTSAGLEPFAGYANIPAPTKLSSGGGVDDLVNKHRSR